MVLGDEADKFVWGDGLAYQTDSNGNLLDVYHADGLGSIRATIDASGNLTSTYQYDEFRAAVARGGTGRGSASPSGSTSSTLRMQQGESLRSRSRRLVAR